MASEGWYYLHENGDIIYKRFEPEAEPGGFVKHVWKLDVTNRANGWTIVLEALALGCQLQRAKELCAKWNLTQEDFIQYALRVKPNETTQKGFNRMVLDIWGFETLEACHAKLDKLAAFLEAQKRGEDNGR